MTVSIHCVLYSSDIRPFTDVKRWSECSFQRLRYNHLFMLDRSRRSGGGDKALVWYSDNAFCHYSDLEAIVTGIFYFVCVDFSVIIDDLTVYQNRYYFIVAISVACIGASHSHVPCIIDLTRLPPFKTFSTRSPKQRWVLLSQVKSYDLIQSKLPQQQVHALLERPTNLTQTKCSGAWSGAYLSL